MATITNIIESWINIHLAKIASLLFPGGYIQKSSTSFPMLKLCLMGRDEILQYRRLMARFHRRGGLTRTGFSQTVLKCAVRDRLIGLISKIQMGQLRYTMNNLRFRIFPDYDSLNPAPWILLVCRERKAVDLLVNFSKRLLLKTNVDFHLGTIHRADNGVLIEGVTN